MAESEHADWRRWIVGIDAPEPGRGFSLADLRASLLGALASMGKTAKAVGSFLGAVALCAAAFYRPADRSLGSSFARSCPRWRHNASARRPNEWRGGDRARVDASQGPWYTSGRGLLCAAELAPARRR